MKYGLPYKGSKNKLAERIVRLLPRKTHLVDLFCGGCAVSHAALLMGKYEHIHINDINWMCPTLFIDALSGKYQNETRWISREDFERLKDTDPYVAVVWSFGNNLRDYLYSREIEPLKKAIHYAMFFHDYTLAQELGHDLSFIEPIGDIQKRYIAVKRYFNRLGHFRQQSFEGGRISDLRCSKNHSAEQAGSPQFGGAILSECSLRKQSFDSQHQPAELGGQKRLILLGERTTTHVGVSPTGANHTDCSHSKKIQATERTPAQRMSKQRITDCNTESVSSRCQEFRGGAKTPITSSVLDYEKVEIPTDSVIYCDIPYEGTNVYQKGESFDYERFYAWAERQTEPVFISSYQTPPDRFDCIEEFTHRCTLSATANNEVVERIFVPKHQRERGNICRQLTLF